MKKVSRRFTINFILYALIFQIIFYYVEFKSVMSGEYMTSQRLYNVRTNPFIEK